MSLTTMTPASISMTRTVDPAPGSGGTRLRKPSGLRRRREAVEYAVYFALIFPIFLVIATLGRLAPARRRLFGGDGLSVFGEAKAAANTVLPYVFKA